MHKVKVMNKNKSLIPTHIYIDDTEVHGVKSLEYFRAAVDEIPVFQFEVIGMPEVMEIGQADIQFQFTPKTIQEATTVLRHNLLADKELYNAFVASIKSAFEDYGTEWDCAEVNDLSKEIADRIIGEK